MKLKVANIKDKNNIAAVYVVSSLTVHNPSFSVQCCDFIIKCKFSCGQ